MVAEEYCWAMTEAATLEPIVFQCVGVWISTEFQMHTSQHIKGLVCGPNIVFSGALIQDALRY
jgi:hypothetical protein